MPLRLSGQRGRSRKKGRVLSSRQGKFKGWEREGFRIYLIAVDRLAVGLSILSLLSGQRTLIQAYSIACCLTAQPIAFALKVS